MAICKRGKYWHIYWKFHGRVVMRSLHTASETEARAREHALQHIRHQARQNRVTLEIMTMQDNVEGIRSAPPALATAVNDDPLAILSSTTRSPKLKDLYQIAMKHRPTLSHQHEREWLRFAASVASRCRYAADLTPRICLDYLEASVGDKSSARYNNLRGQLSIIVRSSMVESGLASNPFDAVIQRRGGDETHYRPFTPDEEELVLKHCCPHWRILSIISRDSGLRLTDCRRLRPCDIENGIITLTPAKTSRFNRAVKIPLLASLKKELGKISPAISPDTPFCDAFPPRLTYPGFPRLSYYGGLLASLGIEGNQEGGVGFHSWRVSFVTRLRAAKIPDQIIRGIVGHTTEQMTDLYSHDTTAAVAAMHDMETSAPPQKQARKRRQK